MKKDRIALVLSPGIRFIGGMALMLAFLFSDSLIYRLAFIPLLLTLVPLGGKRILWKNYLVLIFFITFFNLLNPWGEVLLSLGPLAITKGALTSGLLKGITFTGLILISLVSISRGLNFPGRLGGMIGRVFYYFERIFEQKHRIRKEDLIGTLDEILMEIYSESDPD